MATGRSGRAWRELVAMVKRMYPHVCHLCGQPIDMSLHHHDPMSFTVDHLIPISIDETKAEDITNLRPAHKTCNSRKGNRDYFERARFSRRWK
jgi:5-methylcytosine-specific restriction endonuclease McrA